ncbi:MAG: hypothetical protein KJ732_00125 [Candidatus Margulisbacteria bacterium]|nr:hypothetical protein [Candidatus Margulisiibacteriota bacterium]
MEVSGAGGAAHVNIGGTAMIQQGQNVTISNPTPTGGTAAEAVTGQTYPLTQEGIQQAVRDLNIQNFIPGAVFEFSGNLQIEFTIGADGHVNEVTVRSGFNETDDDGNVTRSYHLGPRSASGEGARPFSQLAQQIAGGFANLTFEPVPPNPDGTPGEQVVQLPLQFVIRR